MNKGLRRIRKSSESCGENMFMADRDQLPSSLSLGASGAGEGPSSTVYPAGFYLVTQGRTITLKSQLRKSMLDMLFAESP